MIQDRLTERRRCKAKNRNGERCRTFALKNEDYCIWHSKSKRALKSKNKPFAIKSNEDLILILQKEIYRIKKKTKSGNVLRRASEIRQLVQLIAELKGGKKKPKVDNGSRVAVDTFQKRVKKAEKRLKKK
ncbi:MAG: hypothetical protein ACFFDI_01030 [Promethearchaeota archaeon]